MMNKLLFLSILLCSTWNFAQQLSWTGTAGDNDFFNEQNWIIPNTNAPPNQGTLDAGVSINFDLQIHSYASLITANGVINLGTGNLSVASSNLFAEAISGGSIDLNYDGYIDLSNTEPFQNNVILNFNSGISWIRTLNLKGTEIQSNHLNQIFVNLQPANYPSNIRLDNYYFEGTVIRSNDMATTPMTLYDESDIEGASAMLSVDIIHNGSAIPNAMNNSVESFVLKKGFMATVAISDDGTGKSKNYIASESDLIINQLPQYLLNDISFIRVIPWNWVNKKGRTGPDTELNNTWNYQWNNTGNSSIKLEYAPMSWGAAGANDEGDIALYKSKYKSTHVMAFNESDNCNDQSGQYNNLCDTDVAVNFYKNLMKTGLRLVSPSCRENAPFGWLKEFHDKANAQDIRIDVIAVHWYDWGSNPTNSPNATPAAVFNRFVNYLENVHNLYGLPIWITEFNANPNRSNATNYGFMQLALPYLESLEYVERYVWYQPNSGVADYYDGSGTALTNVGTFYRDQVSTSSIAELTLSEDSNLDIYYNLLDLTGNSLLVNGFFETGDLTGWSGTNLDILSNENVYDGTTSGRIKANAGNLHQTVTLEPLSSYDLSFYTKWFVAPPAPIEVQILNAADDTVIANAMMTNSTEWNLVELSFTVPAGVTAVKFLIEKGNSPGWFIDNAVLLKVDGTLGIGAQSTLPYSFFPNPSKGIFNLKTDHLFQSYTIHNIQGQVVETTTVAELTDFTIDISNQVNGLYFLTLLDVEGNRFTEKLIIK